MTLLPSTTTTDVEQQQPRVAVLPVGSFEQHGPYLPLATDAIIASVIARAVSSAHPVLELPPITIACSHEHGPWAGTVSISARTLHALIDDIRESLKAQGVSKLILINGHGGNYVLSNVVQEANLAERAMTLFPLSGDWKRARERAGLVSTTHDDMHAGEIETSLLLHAAPHYVREGYESADHDGGERRFLLTEGVAAYTESGVIGYPSLASAEKGAAVLSSLVEDFADHMKVLGL